MVNKKKFKKIVEYNWDEVPSFAAWPLVVLVAITYPLWYWCIAREVHWEEIKRDVLKNNEE